MASANVETALRNHLAANWDESVAKIREPNTSFDPGAFPWIEIRFPGSAIDRADIGANDAPMWDEVGAVMIDIYIPAGSGSAIATAIADAVWELFKGREIEGVRCDSRLQGQSGPREPSEISGVWWGVSYGIAFRYLSVG